MIRLLWGFPGGQQRARGGSGEHGAARGLGPWSGSRSSMPAVAKKNRPLSGWVSPPQQGEELSDLVEGEQGAPSPRCVCAVTFFLEKMKRFS